jgi:hypothetical protein
LRIIFFPHVLFFDVFFRKLTFPVALGLMPCSRPLPEVKVLAGKSNFENGFGLVAGSFEMYFAQDSAR